MSDKYPLVFGGHDDGKRSVRSAMWRGMKKRCPQCGEGHIFNGYTKVRDECDHCGLVLSGHQADDAPPYFTMLISGHIIIPLMLEWKRHFFPPVGLQLLVCCTLLALSIWWLLPITKGALIGVQWANRMHGFSETPQEDVEASIRASETS